MTGRAQAQICFAELPSKLNTLSGPGLVRSYGTVTYLTPNRDWPRNDNGV